MPSRFGKFLRVGVSSDAVSLLRVGRWSGAAPTLLAEHAFAPTQDGCADIGRALDQLLKGRDVAGWPLAFVLDDELARLWQVTPPRGAARPADLNAAAAMRFQSLYGEAAGDWKLSADWSPEAPFFGAVAAPLLVALIGAAERHGLTVVGVEPHFVTAWNRCQGALKAGAWFGLVHDQVLTVGAVEGRRLRAVRALALPHGADQYWLSQVLAREALLLGLSAPACLQLSGPVPPAWTQAPTQSAHVRVTAFTPGVQGASQSAVVILAGGAGGAGAAPARRRLRIDFAPASLRRTLFQLPPAVWAGAVLGLALCVGAALAGQQLAERGRARAAQTRAAEQRLARARVQVLAPAPKARIAPERAAYINAAILQLNLPWRELQEAVAAATPPAVALLTLEPDAKKHVLRLSAEAKTSDDMIAYVQALKEQEFFTRVVLTRHETNEQDPNRPLRFQLEAEWLAR